MSFSTYSKYTKKEKSQIMVSKQFSRPAVQNTNTKSLRKETSKRVIKVLFVVGAFLENKGTFKTVNGFIEKVIKEKT